MGLTSDLVTVLAGTPLKDRAYREPRGTPATATSPRDVTSFLRRAS
jgi:hypothetical protein